MGLKVWKANSIDTAGKLIECENLVKDGKTLPSEPRITERGSQGNSESVWISKKVHFEDNAGKIGRNRILVKFSCQKNFGIILRGNCSN